MHYNYRYKPLPKRRWNNKIPPNLERMCDFYEYTNESCETYAQFRDRMLAKIRFAMEDGDWKGLPVNTGYQFKTNTQEADAKMLRRMLKEGLVKMERRTFRKAWKICGMSVLVLA